MGVIEDHFSVKYGTPHPNSYRNPTVSVGKNSIAIQKWRDCTVNIQDGKGKIRRTVTLQI